MGWRSDHDPAVGSTDCVFAGKHLRLLHGLSCTSHVDAPWFYLVATFGEVYSCACSVGIDHGWTMAGSPPHGYSDFMQGSVTFENRHKLGMPAIPHLVYSCSRRTDFHCAGVARRVETGLQAQGSDH